MLQLSNSPSRLSVRQRKPVEQGSRWPANWPTLARRKARASCSVTTFHPAPQYYGPPSRQSHTLKRQGAMRLRQHCSSSGTEVWRQEIELVVQNGVEALIPDQFTPRRAETGSKKKEKLSRALTCVPPGMKRDLSGERANPPCKTATCVLYDGFRACRLTPPAGELASKAPRMLGF